MSQRKCAHYSVDPSLDPTIEALASCRKRSVLYYFLDSDAVTASVDAVCEYVLAVDPTATDRSHVMLDLHHSVLPSLDHVGMIDFDARSDTIRVRDLGRWEAVLAVLTVIAEDDS